MNANTYNYIILIKIDNTWNRNEPVKNVATHYFEWLSKYKSEMNSTEDAKCLRQCFWTLMKMYIWNLPKGQRTEDCFLPQQYSCPKLHDSCLRLLRSSPMWPCFQDKSKSSRKRSDDIILITKSNSAFAGLLKKLQATAKLPFLVYQVIKEL